MNKPENPLHLAAINVVISGSGGIAAALVRQLLAQYPVARLFNLQRRGSALSDDPRLHTLHVDAQSPASIEHASATIAEHCAQVHLVINTVGVLHDERLQPEKRLRDLTMENLTQAMNINGYFIAHLAQALDSLLRHNQPAILASLSARVGSIDDNRMGGWYSYRTSKAAHNMLLKCIANEWRISHKNTCLLALHPGTVQTALSAPFVKPGYRNRLLSPDECATALLHVLRATSVADSGSFLGWDGARIPW